ncbi:MAG: NYN domain-containing protein [Bacillota bacterium]|jgi:predicted RNA-binding protein with PIN domain
MTSQLVLIDGYNIIRQWQEARFFPPGEDLDPLRERLIKHLCSCFAYWDAECWLVFDAHLVSGGLGCIQSPARCLQVIYTREGQTADSFIERAAAELQSEDRTVTVCTSDWAEQNIALAKGAQRLSARDLLVRVRQAEEEIGKLSNNPGNWQKSWLEDSLPTHVQQQLRRLRDDQPHKFRPKKSKDER